MNTATERSILLMMEDLAGASVSLYWEEGGISVSLPTPPDVQRGRT